MGRFLFQALPSSGLTPFQTLFLQFYSSCGMYVVQVGEISEGFIAHNGAGGQENDVLLLFLFFTHLHAADVDPMFSQGGTDRADDTRPVLILDQKNVSLRDSLQIKIVDAEDSGPVFAEDGAGDNVSGLQSPDREFDEAGKIL